MGLLGPEEYRDMSIPPRSPISQSKAKYSCKKCANKEKSLKRFGSKPLVKTHPQLAEEWDYKNNGDLTPYNVTAHLHKRVNWICHKGHHWPAFVSVRARLNIGCPHCKKETSFDLSIFDENVKEVECPNCHEMVTNNYAREIVEAKRSAMRRQPSKPKTKMTTSEPLSPYTIIGDNNYKNDSTGNDGYCKGYVRKYP